MATLAQYRQVAARLLGFWEEWSNNDSGVPFAPPGDGPTDAITVLQLISSVQPASAYQDKYIFRKGASAIADRDRLIAGYSPANGILTPDRVWTLGIGTDDPAYFEILTPFSGTDLNDMVNAALRRCFLVAEFSFTPTANAQRHALTTAAPWLTETSWVRQVGMLVVNESRTQVDPFRRAVRGAAVQDGGVVYLEHPGRTFKATDAVYVRAVKPAYFHCRPALGAYGAQSGLALETDEAVPQTDWVGAAVMIEALDRLDATNAQGDAKTADAQRARWSARFTTLTRAYFKPPPLSFAPLQWWGPSW